MWKNFINLDDLKVLVFEKEIMSILERENGQGQTPKNPNSGRKKTCILTFHDIQRYDVADVVRSPNTSNIPLLDYARFSEFC